MEREVIARIRRRYSLSVEILKPGVLLRVFKGHANNVNSIYYNNPTLFLPYRLTTGIRFRCSAFLCGSAAGMKKAKEFFAQHIRPRLEYSHANDATSSEGDFDLWIPVTDASQISFEAMNPDDNLELWLQAIKESPICFEGKTFVDPAIQAERKFLRE